MPPVDLEELAKAIEKTASEEWDRILIRRDIRPGEQHAGSSYWDGRQAAFRDAARALRQAATDEAAHKVHEAMSAARAVGAVP